MKNNETLILALGLNAQNIVNLAYKDNPDINFLCLDYEKQIINTSEIKTIWYNNLKFQKDKYDFEEYKNVLLNRTSKFNEIILEYKNIIIVSCLGEKYSSDTLFEIIKYLKKLNINHTLFIVNPSVFDGKKACDLSIKEMGKLTKLKYSLGNNLFIYESTDAIKTNPRSINEANLQVYKKASKALSMILELNNK